MAVIRRRQEHTRRAAGELENEVLAALWAADRPQTPGDVQQELPGELAYTTVMTILKRLYEKGLVIRTRAGRAYAYAPAQRAEDHVAQSMTELLAQGGDPAAVLSRFVDRLTAPEEEALRALLDRPRQTAE